MRAKLVMLCAAALVAGCSGNGSADNAAGNDGAAMTPAENVAEMPSADPMAPPADAANSELPQDTSLPRGLPPADAEYRYVGRWAATEPLCENGAWRFEERRLSTAGEVSCDFNSVEQVPGGYDIAATCLAEGTRSEDRIELRFAESAEAMLVSSEMWDGVGLIPCEG